MKKDLKELKMLEKERRPRAEALRQECFWHGWGTEEKPVCGVGENYSHYKDFCFVLHEMGRHSRGQSRQIT